MAHSFGISSLFRGSGLPALLRRRWDGLLSAQIGTDGAPMPAGYALCSLSLRFVDPAVEQRFASGDIARALPTIRVFLVAACLLYAVFGILDAFVIPDVKIQAWLIRYGGVCPVLIGVTLLTFSPVFLRIAQAALALCVSAAGAGIVVMTALASPPGNALYYAGLIMVVIYGSTLIRLRYVYAVTISIVLVAAYELVATLANPIPVTSLLNNDFFLCMAVAMGVFTGYIPEFQARRDFASTELLQREKARSERLLAETQAASRSKSDFLAMMSHELRTPLNAILGFSEIMQQRLFGPIGSDRYAGYVEDIHDTAEHLMHLIADILDLSKAEAGKLTLSEEEIDIFSMLGNCFRLMRERAAENGLRLLLQEPDGARPVMRVDPTLIKQVFLNILGNAIKFTPAGGSVRAMLSTDQQGTWLVHFIDTGIGIAAGDLPRVVEPFVQVQSPFVRKHGGIGLGLPLVKKIIELHGGNLTIASIVGAGTTVTVSIPPERLVRRRAAAAGAA